MAHLTSLFQQALSWISSHSWFPFVQAIFLLVLSIFLLGAIFRLIFGKGSTFNRAVSASLSVLLVYLAVILIELFLPDYREALPALPFVQVDSEHLFLQNVLHLPGEILYPSILRLLILSFIVNLLEEFLPEGKNFLSWYLWRVVVVLASLTPYAILCSTLEASVPSFFGVYAKLFVWAYMALILLTGILKVGMGLILSAVNPLIGSLYAVFYTDPIGKQLSKSILTALLIMTGIALAYLDGLTEFAFADFSLLVYGPICLAVFVGLYFFGKFL